MNLWNRLSFYTRPDRKSYIPFTVEGKEIGWLKPDFAERMLDQEKAFCFSDQAIKFAPSLTTAEDRSHAIADLLGRKRHLIAGWRDELFPVLSKWGEEPFFLIERSAAPLFGILAFAVNLVGYVKRDDGYYFWLGRRSMSKHLAPGALDVTAGGGQPAHLSIEENLYKEAWEEAGIPASFVKMAYAFSPISFALETEIGLRREYQFNYALELPENFRPHPVDGEVTEFLFLHQSELLHLLEGQTPFIIDTVFVLIQFMIEQNIWPTGQYDLALIRSAISQSVNL